ncbi:hypothetical protein CVIRNUC_008003 [Coccomyxa viridis]|uniref:RNA methyltransferase n=1 Tax=Coccomyxa viridis TaxID=1274662 RepID=A0AAV1IBT2_9CHLO|nr:hypothetical protein CVIRNUC_008003 [Coccomyxa viridis]
MRSNADGSSSPQRSLPAQQAGASHSNAASSDEQDDNVGPSLPAQPPQQRKARFVAVHGNYHHYYGTRSVADFQEDTRLKVMEKPWFQNKQCLDIGCNEGMITLALASHFGTASMLGVDIDRRLIGRASSHLAEQRSQASAELARASHARQSHAVASDGSGAQQRQASPNTRRRMASAAVQGLRGTFFQHGSFLELDLQAGAFDTITCFSVTKWIHLNGGDEALQALLAKVYTLLSPGGRFILEPQQWVSYRKAVRKPGVSAQLQRSLSSLQMRPEEMPQYLSDVLGFKLVRELNRSASGQGFDRPMYLFRKPLGA